MSNRTRQPIITSYMCPPIPVRSSDWCAYRDPEITPYGWGATEEEAIKDLLTWEEGDDDDFVAANATAELYERGML